MEKEKFADDIDVEQLLDEKSGIEDSADDDLGDSEEITGVEPFDPNRIRIDQQRYSVKYVFELYEDTPAMLVTNPNFQRKRVWQDRKRQSLLIESLILRIPVPAFYFYERQNSSFLIIDGQQRLTTIFDYLEGKFELTGLEYIGGQCNGKKFAELPVPYQQRIFRTQLEVNVLDAHSPLQVIFDIFRRINTGGIPLTRQEMRNAVCGDKLRNFLVAGSENRNYLQATREKISDLRMNSQEMVLRFAVLYLRYDFHECQLKPLEYSKLSTLMDHAVISMFDLPDDRLREIYEAFDYSMKNCAELFGELAFEKLYRDPETDEIRPTSRLINRALFTSFSVLLANPWYKDMDMAEYRDEAVKCLAGKLEVTEYQNAVSVATGDRKNIFKNFKYSQEVLDECLK